MSIHRLTHTGQRIKSLENYEIYIYICTYINSNDEMLDKLKGKETC